MKVNIEKILKLQAKELINDANFPYYENTNSLDYERAHVIAQKTLYRMSVLKSFLNNTVNNNDVEKSIVKLSEKMFKQVGNDIDYMYPEGELGEDNSHVVMQLIKRTGEDLSHFFECFNPNNKTESQINIINILKIQFNEYNHDIDYAYPDNEYNDDNAHTVIQGLMGKSQALYSILENAIPENKEEQKFKNIYMEKISGIILDLLHSAYDKDEYYKENGHDIFLSLIHILKFEIKNLEDIKLTENANMKKDITTQEVVSHQNIHENKEEEVITEKINAKEKESEDKKEDKFINTEELKKKIKNLM